MKFALQNVALSRAHVHYLWHTMLQLWALHTVYCVHIGDAEDSGLRSCYVDKGGGVPLFDVSSKCRETLLQGVTNQKIIIFILVLSDKCTILFSIIQYIYVIEDGPTCFEPYMRFIFRLIIQNVLLSTLQHKNIYS
jgi:hypothetical protein